MDLAYKGKRLADVARALRLAKQLEKQERWPRERLEEHRQRALDALVRHAAAHSPFYRERLSGVPGDGPVELRSLPTLDKATMMDRFDDLVSDRRLRRDELLAHLEGLDHDALYLGEHRVMTTSGSSGRKGLFVYDRSAWVPLIAQLLRFNSMVGLKPRVPRVRMAAVAGGSPTHMTRRASATMGVGVHRVLPLAVTMPVERIVEELNAFRPNWLFAYPSVAVLLADEQRRGRLGIDPEGICTSSELCTDEVRERIVSAFGVAPFDLFGTTEGAWAGSCEHGMHLFEDLSIVENVDEDGRPVPDGAPGAKLLVTNLFNRVQPLIRFEISDVMRIGAEPCPCGRTLKRVASVEGRADDILYLPGARGRVAVHPTHFAPLTADPDVREFQVVQEGDRLRLRIALCDEGDAALVTSRLGRQIGTRLAELGVEFPDLEVETCDGLERPASGKLQLVVAGARRPR